jgi:hypothetical protein
MEYSLASKTNSFLDNNKLLTKTATPVLMNLVCWRAPNRRSRTKSITKSTHHHATASLT